MLHVDLVMPGGARTKLAFAAFCFLAASLVAAAVDSAAVVVEGSNSVRCTQSSSERYQLRCWPRLVAGSAMR